MATFLVLQSLSDILIPDAEILIAEERDVEWIERELRLMQSSLEYVEAKRQPSEDETKWAGEAREIFQEVENAIDIFLSKTEHYIRRGPLKRSVLVFNRGMDRLELRKKMKKIMVQIHDFTKQRPKQQDGTYSLQCRPSSSREPQITRDAIDAVTSIIHKVNAVVSQNLLVLEIIGVLEIVESIVDEYKHLHGILSNFKSEEDLDERTIAWFEEIKDTSHFIEQIFESFINKGKTRISHFTEQIFESFKSNGTQQLIKTVISHFHEQIFESFTAKVAQKLRNTVISNLVASPFYKDLRFSKKNLLRVRFRILDLYKKMWTFGIGDLEECPDLMVSVITRVPSRAVGRRRVVARVPSHVVETTPTSFESNAFDQLGSIKGNLRIIQALFKDINGIDYQDQRVKDWLDEMREIAHDPIIKDLDEYVSKSEEDQGRAPLWKPKLVLREWIDKQRILRKIKLMSHKFRDISERKWTYDIGKIEGKRSSNDVEDQSQPLNGPSTSDVAGNQDIRNPKQEQVESIRRELKLMCALCEDVKSMNEQNARIKVWAEQMQDAAGDAKKFIDSYVYKIEQKRIGVLRRFHFTEFVVPREIKRIKNRIHEISKTKWTYDIGGIQRRKDWTSVDPARDISIPEPESPSVQARPISSDRTDIKIAFSIYIFYLYVMIQVVRQNRRTSNPIKQLEKNVESIKNHQSLMRALLEDVGELERCDGRLKAWAKEIKVVAIDVDAAILDYNETTKNNWRGFLKRYEIALRFEHIMHKIEDISSRKMFYSIEDMQAVMGQLLTDNEHYSIISIVGMEGIEDILKDIEEQVLRSLCEHKRKHKGLQEQKGQHTGREEPMQTLNSILKVNRYLIVLDNVSTTEIWDTVVKEFQSTFNGRIVLTTRDVDVATHANPKNVPHKLHKKLVLACGGLPRAILQLREQFSGVESTSDAWSRVLENPNLDQKPWQKTVDVMKGGLPLYLKRTLFYLGRFPAEFEIPLRRLIILWIAEGLVHQRRGDEDPPESVAQRYLAELIDRNMVQVAKRNLNGSVKKCRLPYALQEFLSSESKNTSSAKSHTKNSPSARKILHLAHHSDHIPANLLPDYKHVISFRSFDTREGSQPGKELGKFLDQCISRRYFLILRVLDLERVFRPELPKALGELVLLRYLGLRWTYLESLPSFISKLLNLQTLDVKHTSISSLPTSIWKMAQLRHLFLDESYRCRFVPRPSGYCLTDLQTLWSVFIDEDSPVRDGLDRLINLKRLGVTSRLMSSRSLDMSSQLELVAEWVEKLKQLESLRLKSFDKKGKPWDLPKMRLTDHPHLSSIYLLGRIEGNGFLVSGLPLAVTELTLSGSGLLKDPMPTLGHFPNLRVLRLFSESFLGKHMHCSSGSFPQLRILKLWKLDQLNEWKVENGAFPNIIDLNIRSCKNLRMFPGELRNSRTLQISKFSDMPEKWDGFEKNVPCTPNDDNDVDKSNVAKTSINLLSEIREKLLKRTINKSQKIFLRRIATEELPIESTECPFCGAEPESAVHLFFLCKPVKMIWFSKWGIRTDDFPKLSISEWINHILHTVLDFRRLAPQRDRFSSFCSDSHGKNLAVERKSYL
ncbi:hypothetical protein Acr_00g0021790 [Actinidia rufa]|uniref:Uncharacterized protein n=1 Tax=Actinidia rufa TaxID=165716 RepID=A0A7J0DCC2_9ERIC|nr:hypothetical protein Acr_00g0021790 [Actinidia rufa]